MLQENIIYQVTGKDLKEFALTLIASTKKELEEAITEERAERYLSPNEVAQMLDVNLTTLWRWQRANYLTPCKVGAKSRYKYSEVKALLTKKRAR